MATQTDPALQRLTLRVMRTVEKARGLRAFEGKLAQTQFEVKIKKGSGNYSGTAYPGRNKVILRFAEEQPTEVDIDVVILHEMTHIVVPEAAHGTEFIERHYQACSEFFGANFEPDWSQTRQGRRNRAYALEQLHLIPLCREWNRRHKPEFNTRYQVFETAPDGREVIHNFLAVERTKALALSGRLKAANRDGTLWDAHNNTVSRALAGFAS